jgi:hypothetical protein
MSALEWPGRCRRELLEGRRYRTGQQDLTVADHEGRRVEGALCKLRTLGMPHDILLGRVAKAALFFPVAAKGNEFHLQIEFPNLRAF